jgi:hypothetical protein
MARAFSWQLLQPPLAGQLIMEVGRPSDENSGGALLHAVNADRTVKSGTIFKERAVNTLRSFIRYPFFIAVFLLQRVCHAVLSASL